MTFLRRQLSRLVPEHGDERFVVRIVVLGTLALWAEAVLMVSVWGH